MTHHKHDYRMLFENPEQPLKFTLRCDCGKVARDMPTAIRDMRKSMHRSPPLMVIVAAVLAAGFVIILAAIHPHPAIPAVDEKHVLKGDMEHHVRIIPIDRPPVVETTTQPVVEQPQAPPWPVESLPIIHKQPPPPKVVQNICDRTGGRKVETNNGRSWHCEYNHRN